MLKILWKNKKLTMQLAFNDFKTKFAGSYLGIIWAFVQPVITVLVYWLVFEKGFKQNVTSPEGLTIPFVLWLVAGIVPWFFFSDAWNGGTNALIEYNYLVKKVVFQIDILPVVKIISTMFVHVFFVCFAIVLYICYGRMPSIYLIQVVYYSVALCVLATGLSYFTSAIVVFFRDLTQIINIVLQVGIWVTPIMWNIQTFDMSDTLKSIFKLNPLYYIVSGYRDAFIDHNWFWQKPRLTIYYWVITLLVYVIGTRIFKKLKIHFADVL